MIDTIKFRIPLTYKQHQNLMSKACEVQKYDHRRENIVYNYSMCQLNVGSYDRRVTVFIRSSTECEVEFSVPKYYFGHNVYLLYPQRLNATIQKFRADMLNDGLYFSSIYEWQIVRLDLCYAWKTYNENVARTLMYELQKLEHARKKKYVFPGESVMFKGSTYTTKFYLKKPEYYKHDFRELKRVNIDLAYCMLNNSQGVIRFEVTMRNKALQHYFKKPRIILNDINYDKIEHILNIMLKKVTKGMGSTSTDSAETFELLQKAYSKSKARSLWAFWKLYYDKDLYSRQLLKETYTRQTIHYNITELVKAGVGLPKDSINNDFDFNIPSDLAVNDAPGA